MNPAAEQLLGTPMADVVLTKSCRDCLDCRLADGSPVTGDCPCLSVLDSGEPMPYFELRVRSSDGDYHAMAVSASPVTVGDRRLTALVMRDLSERLRLEEALDRRRRAAEFLYAAGRQLAVVSGLDEGVRNVLTDLAGLLGLTAAGWYETVNNHFRLRTWVGEAGSGSDRITGRWLQAADAYRGPRFAPGRESTVAPLRFGERTLGLLVAVGPRLDDLDRQTLAAVAQQLAVGVENVRLYSQAKDVAVSEERRRLGSEMHDSLAQTLAIVHSRVRQLSDRLSAGSADEAIASVQALERVVQQAHREVRQAIFDLKSPMGHGPAFVTGLREYLEEFELQTGMKVHAHLPDEDPYLSLQAEVQVFRIMQEALNNARKHSGAHEVSVHLHRGHDGLWHFQIRDNGCGFDPRRGRARGHFGLHIMQERAKAIGGLLGITSAPGRGTVVEIEFPTAQE